jgi:DNA (cytosine-5)-methyltransferase 1
MRFLSVCSGIEAASVAWNPLGWRAAAFSEIESFPCAVLAHHYPTVPNWGDMTKFEAWPDATIDLLCGGTPCQSFSIAGLRKGLSDPRGNLMLTYLAIAARYRPQWVVWENVPGVLSSWSGADETGALHPGQDEWEGDETSDLSCFLAGLTELGYGWAYRSFDAQFAGLAQRRERVFVVGCLGSRARAAAVLLERHGLSGHPAPRREARQGTADRAGISTAVSSGHGWWDRSEVGATIRAQDSVTKADTLVAHTLRVPSNGAAWRGDGCDGCDNLVPIAFGGNNTSGPIDVAAGLNAKGGAGRMDFDSETFIAHSLRGEGLDASEDGTGRGTPLVPVVGFDCKASGRNGFGIGEIASTQRAMGHADSHTNGGGHQAIMTGMQVRRLTPRECERLQGFQDDYTLITVRGKPAADGPRYKAIGNSWAVPCARWIGQRIQQVEALRVPMEATCKS